MTSTSFVPLLMAFTSALSAAAAPASPIRVSAGSHQTEQRVSSESPIACVPDALSPVERKRHFDELSPMLRKLKTGVRELRDGYEFSFPSDRKTFDLVAEWVIQEQLCCPFFELNIRLDREGGSLWLRLSGRKGTKEFIRDDFAPWFRS